METAPLPKESRRILLVEDHEATRQGLTRLLEGYGFRVSTAADGTSALRLLKEAPPPDVVITDMRLPDLDGRDVARQASGLTPRPRIALITGWDVDEERDGLAAWGIDSVFKKPVNMDSLFAMLGVTLRARGGVSRGRAE